MIPLIKPYIQLEEVEKEFREIFDSGMLTRGKYSRTFPQKICAYTGAKYAFNTSNATTALAIALEVLEIKAGDEVAVSDFSFPASVNVIEARGATPVFVDVDRKTFNMLPEELEKKITPRTKAVIFVCALGNPDGLLEIKEICQKHGLPLINDAACAIGSRIGEQAVGSIADMACFSFHPRKLLTSGEGGSITTNHAEYAEALEVKLMHGEKITDGHIDFITYGFNYRLPELQCAMLIKQIEKLDSIIEERIRIQEAYCSALKPLGYEPQVHRQNIVHNMQSVVFCVPEGISRDELCRYLYGQGIETTIGTYCLSACTYYRKKYNDIQKNAFWLERNTITLPCYHNVDVDTVIKGIMTFNN